MVDADEKRSEFKCLGETVGSVSSEDALKLFHEYVQMKKSEKIRGDVGELSGSGSGFDCSSSLENYFEKLLLYLEKYDYLLEALAERRTKIDHSYIQTSCNCLSMDLTRYCLVREKIIMGDVRGLVYFEFSI
ncbi:hypothetical protein Dimus_030061 [Dionaea muscipula]